MPPTYTTGAPSGCRPDPADSPIDDLDEAERTIERVLPGSTAQLMHVTDKVGFRISLTASGDRCRDGILTAKWLLEDLSNQLAAAARSL